MTKVLFVCLANICRSPAAEGVFKALVEQKGLSSQIHAESCGIGDWRVGELPDERIREAAKARGIILTSRAKKFKKEFLEEFDYILGADQEVLGFLHQYAMDAQHKSKIHLITAFGGAFKGEAIPDPYYGGDGAFEHTLDVLEDACLGLIKVIKSTSLNN